MPNKSMRDKLREVKPGAKELPNYNPFPGKQKESVLLDMVESLRGAYGKAKRRKR
jgi:hypothetical protein